MASQWQFLILSVLLFQEIAHSFIIPQDPVCYNHDNDTNATKENCSLLMKFQRNLGKYRNFYANLLQEENQNFAVEIEELYNLVCTALVESDLSKKQRMLYYSMWLVETTKNLEDFLIAKGIRNI